MATDLSSQEVMEGDVVMIPCVVKAVSTGDRYNLEVETQYPTPDANGNVCKFIVHSMQAVKIPKPPAPRPMEVEMQLAAKEKGSTIIPGPNDTLLKFKEPNFEEGLNVAVRLGETWRDIFRAKDSRPFGVLLCDQAGKVIRPATVNTVAHMRFDMLPEGWLDKGHCEACRTREGLAKVMKECYGDAFSTDKMCSVLIFEPR